MGLTSAKDQKFVDFIRSKLNLPDWSLAMSMRGYLELEEIKESEVKPDMYSHDSIIHEDDLVISYLNSFAYTIKVWVESKQEHRISATIDKFACILTAYIHGLNYQKVR